MRKTAIISGVTGQDGSYMAELLISLGYDVYGLTRDPALIYSKNIEHLRNKLKLQYTTYQLSNIINIIEKIKPNEIYNLTGQSYVSKSWEMIEDTFFSQGVIATRFLEAILEVNPKIKFLNASSSEIFNGHNCNKHFNELTPINPINPYGSSKAFAHTMVNSFRESKGLYAVNAILFPHESPRRHANFAFMKIIKGAVNIKIGKQSKLELGNIEVFRDWSYAPSIVIGMQLMLNIDNPKNLCLCSGQAYSINQIINFVFDYLGIDCKDFVSCHNDLIRVNDPKYICGDPTEALKILNWTNSHDIKLLIKTMIDYEFNNFNLKDQPKYINEKPFQLTW